MSDKIMSFTQDSLAEALDSVRCLSDLGPELIAEQVFADIAQQPAASDEWKSVHVDPVQHLLTDALTAADLVRSGHRSKALADRLREHCSLLSAMFATAPAAPAAAERPTDSMLDGMRKRGLSIDGENAYKRDLIDCIVGALICGKQGVNPPPAGHWAHQFWEMARAEGEIQEWLAKALPAAEQPDAVKVPRELAKAIVGDDLQDSRIRGCAYAQQLMAITKLRALLAGGAE